VLHVFYWPETFDLTKSTLLLFDIFYWPETQLQLKQTRGPGGMREAISRNAIQDRTRTQTTEVLRGGKERVRIPLVRRLTKQLKHLPRQCCFVNYVCNCL